MYWNFYSVCSWDFRGRCISRPTLPMKVLVEVWKSQLMFKRVIKIWVELGRPYSSAYDPRFGCQWKWLQIKVSREISRDQRIRSKGPECNETSRIPERKTGSCCFAFYTLLNLISLIRIIGFPFGGIFHAENRSVFRTLSNIFDGTFCKNSWKLFIVFVKKLHYRCFARS